MQEGILEPTAGEALQTVIDHPEWLRLVGRRIAVLGAGAETSPLETLLSWGAEVIAVDLPRPEMWKRLLAAGINGAGRLHVPVTSSTRSAPTAAATPHRCSSDSPHRGTERVPL